MLLYDSILIFRGQEKNGTDLFLALVIYSGSCQLAHWGDHLKFITTSASNYLKKNLRKKYITRR